MSDDEIKSLEQQLDGLRNEARTQPLLQLGRLYFDRYWRSGPGTAAGRPYLDAGIRALTEAHGYLSPGDRHRGQAAALLGTLLLAKCTPSNGGTARDREQGIDVLEEAQTYTVLHPMVIGGIKGSLGQLYLGRVTELLAEPDFMMAAVRSGPPPAAFADVRHAQGCFRDIVEAAPSPQLVAFARSMLAMSDSTLNLLSAFGSGPLGVDMGRMIQTLGEFQSLMNGMTNLVPGGRLPSMAEVFDGTWFADFDQMDWPINVVPGQEPAEPAEYAEVVIEGEIIAERHGPEAPPPVAVDVEAMREELRALLSESQGTDGRAEYESVLALLRAEEPPSWIDDFVELATGIVYSADTVSGTDHFLLATALYLRGRRDDGDWNEPERSGAASGSDAQAAVPSLLSAAETLPVEDPDSIPALLFLATLLPGGALAGLAEQLTGVAAAVRAFGAEALVFPEPVRFLRLDAATGRIEAVAPADPNEAADNAAAAPGTAARAGKTILVVGEDLPASVDDDLAVSYIASLTQLVDLSRRKTRPITEEPVFIANPRGDRENATMEAMLLRRTFYPRSTGLGRLVESCDGPGTASEVRAHLNASLLHLACGITADGALELADSAELDLSGLSAPHGGLVILPPGYFLPWADTLIEAGFTGVVGWRRPVPEHIAALMLFVLHTELVDNGRSPAAAVRAVRHWYHRPDPAILPRLLAGSAGHLGESRAEDWASLVHRGR